MNPQELWIFGYGSLIWKHDDIPHTESKVCFIEGYKRRAWQGSTDHRGTPKAPGRVVSVYSRADFFSLDVHHKDIKQFDSNVKEPWEVYGIAFKLTDQEREKVCYCPSYDSKYSELPSSIVVAKILESLAFREKDGYEPLWLPVFIRNPETGTKSIFESRALTYVAPPSNSSFLGFDTHQNVAEHILKSEGPSGPNLDYHRHLRDALVSMGHPDPHISSVVQMAISTAGNYHSSV